MMKEIILCYQGEMALKGLNRATFEAVLSKALRYRVRELGRFQVYKAQSTMYVEPRDQEAEANVGEAYERVRKVFGLAALSRAAVCEKTLRPFRPPPRSTWAGRCKRPGPLRWRPSARTHPSP